MKPSLNTPSRNDVELCLQQLEIEDQREREVIRNYWDQQREQQKPVFVPRWGAIFAALAVFSAVAYMLWQIWRAWPLLMGALK